ncbi:MAG: hypothetical protein KAU17_13210 [Spirochaetales bacterium]|jgi:hypothetical protein|nr:hypothetical protein [Spirochaetales bacterium]
MKFFKYIDNSIDNIEKFIRKQEDFISTSLCLAEIIILLIIYLFKISIPFNAHILPLWIFGLFLLILIPEIKVKTIVKISLVNACAGLLILLLGKLNYKITSTFLITIGVGSFLAKYVYYFVQNMQEEKEAYIDGTIKYNGYSRTIIILQFLIVGGSYSLSYYCSEILVLKILQLI